MKRFLHLRFLSVLMLMLCGVTGAWAENSVTIWSEDWTGANTATSSNEDATPSAFNPVLYSQSANTVYVRNEKVAGGTAPELLLSSGKTWTIKLTDLKGYVSGDKLTLSYKSNNTKASVKINGQSVTISNGAGEITLNDNATTLAIVFSCSGNTRLDDLSLIYTPSTGGQVDPIETVATPTFTPEAGTYTEAQNVTIACATEGATIHYTTDGTTPTASSTTYSAAIPVSSTTTIKAIAIKEGMNNSAIATATYTINIPQSTSIDLRGSTATITLNGFSSFSGNGYKSVDNYTIKDNTTNTSYKNFSVSFCMVSNL